MSEPVNLTERPEDALRRVARESIAAKAELRHVKAERDRLRGQIQAVRALAGPVACEPGREMLSDNRAIFARAVLDQLGEL